MNRQILIGDMIDINVIKNNPEILHNALKNRNKQDVTNDLLDLYNNYLKCVTNLQQLQEQRNRLTDEFVKAKQNNNITLTHSLTKTVQQLKEQITNYNNQLDEAKAQYESLLATIPNIPSNECPIGPDETIIKY